MTALAQPTDDDAQDAARQITIHSLSAQDAVTQVSHNSSPQTNQKLSYNLA